MKFLARFVVLNDEQLKHIATAFHAAATGFLVVYGYQSLQKGHFVHLILAVLLFISLEYIAVLVLGKLKQEP